MAIGDCAVVGAPVVHHAVHVLESILCRVEARREPSGRPGRVGTLVEDVVHVLRQAHAPAFGKLQHRPQTCDHIESEHSHRHTLPGHEVRRVAAAAEVIAVRRHPAGGSQAGLHIAPAHLPRGFHHRPALGILHLAGSIKSGRARIDQVDETTRSGSAGTLSGHAFYGVRTPVGAHVGEHHAAVGQQVAEEHRDAVEEVVLCGEYLGFAYAVPVVA